MIEFEGTITEQLLERASQRHYGRSALVIGIVLLVAGIGGFLAMPAPFAAQHFFPIMAAVIGGAMVTRWFHRRAPEPVPVSGSVSEQRLTYRVGENEEHVQWSDFSHAVVGPDFVILQRSRFFNNFLAREFFRSEAEWNELLDIVRRHVTVIPPQTPSRMALMALVWLALFALVIVAYELFGVR
ncbi:MAG TPA: hypothetical protein VG106_13180 [Vicinamibacterales bacterium]|nr:hypothetical protein [Vicinamibacterales bacterium]